jgi:hypothetical protein
LKRVLRAALPRHAREVINALRYAGDRRIWEFLASGRIAARLRADVLFTRTSVPFAGIEASVLSPTAAFGLLEPSLRWEQRETVVRFKGTAFIEPDGGWIICNPSHLVESCLIDAQFARKPDFKKYVRARLGRERNVRQEGAVVHLRDWGEGNYWHFLNDIVGGRLRLAAKYGFDRDIPLLIGRRAYEQRFVRELLSVIGPRWPRVVIQEDEFVQCKEVIFFETPRHSLESVEFVMKVLGAAGGNPAAERRVLLGRATESGRPISNMDEVKEVCEQFGFEVLQTEGMSVADQIMLFSQIRYLVAVHGAGLTNIMFRRGAPLAVLELFPWRSYPDWGWWHAPSPHYFWMTQALGFQYDAMFAQVPAPGGELKAPVEIDGDALRRRLESILS